ncbi:HAD family hydrolase [Dactylosporangium sp. NBC_01737]|uniref:HAD family hydrolase n=1 Tax=Dactylosporangium sp. NBC_01737 TaxID=2975959 RepID=UPI003FA3D6F6
MSALRFTTVRVRCEHRQRAGRHRTRPAQNNQPATALAARTRAGKPITIVSNNSAPAIEAYLSTHRLNGHIAYVVGRAYAQPERMKPNPEPIRRAMTALNVESTACVFIGDSLF